MNQILKNTPTAAKKHHVLLLLGAASLAIVMLIGCLQAKRFVLNTAISRGMGTPVSPLPGILFSGLAFSAPIQGAFLLSLLPCSWFRRVAIACAWMAIVVLAFSIGNQAHSFQDSPAMFSNRLLSILPLFSFGCFIPLGLLRCLRGWQLISKQFTFKSQNQQISLSSFFTLTLVISLCLFALELGPQSSYVTGLIGMLAGVVCGFIFSFAIYIIMKLSPVFSLVGYILIGAATYLVARLIILAAGGGPVVNSNALFLSTLVFASLSGFVVANCFGVDLMTGRPESRGKNEIVPNS